MRSRDHSTGVKSFTVTANSVPRAADLEAVVLAAASAAGCPADVTKRKALTADELAGTPPQADDGGPGEPRFVRKRF
jgi:hypothetical protein